jgi:geranylgeranyl diphosphate synthase type I
MAEVQATAPELVPVITAMQELSVGGKRLRGSLTLLGYRAAGGDPEDESEVVKAGVVMELFHLGLLCWDDVFDRDSRRRGVTTVHARYDDLHLGEAMAVLAGGFTYSWGLEILSTLAMNRGAVLEALHIWGRYFTRVGYGEALDVLTEQRGDVSEATMLQVLALKSGEYSCVLPLQLGAALAGADAAMQKQLYDYGMELGWVFQIRDDYLAEFGDAEKTGKPVGNDSREGKKTYATLYGAEKTLQEVEKHVAKGRVIIQNSAFKIQVVKPIFEEILDWMATRES